MLADHTKLIVFLTNPGRFCMIWPGIKNCNMKIKKQTNEVRFVINGPPDEMCCMRCGRHVDDLQPFDIEDESSIEHCSEKRLVKNFRELKLVASNKLYERIIQNLSNGTTEKDLAVLYGADKVQAAISYESLQGNWEKSWECRDCIKEYGPFKQNKN